MYLNGFTVEVISGREKPGGYVEIGHGTQYKLRLINQRSVRCDAQVEIDGKHVGTFRINSYDGITIERPVNDTGHFTAYKTGTTDAIAAGLNEGSPDLGLIKVTFTPEVVVNTYWSQTSAPKSLSATFTTESSRTHESVGTGLSGISHQKFVDAPQLSYDYSRQVIIHLRLVARRDSDQPRPLSPNVSPVPPRI